MSSSAPRRVAWKQWPQPYRTAVLAAAGAVVLTIVILLSRRKTPKDAPAAPGAPTNGTSARRGAASKYAARPAQPAQ